MKKYLLVLLLCGYAAHAIPVTPVIIPHITFTNGFGLPCAGCKLWTYSAGTTTPLATYVDATGVSQNTNPITLDAAGGAFIWVGSNSYKFLLKDIFGSTVWTADQVNAGNLFPCASANAIQTANVAGTGLACDASITINVTTHTINVGTLPANHVTIGALGTPTLWTFDTTSPASALASLGGQVANPGTINQVAIYAVAGNTVSGSSAIPNGITATTQTAGDNSTKPATTAYVALPGAINPTSVQVAGGIAMTGNQGNGVLTQHSTGGFTAGNGAKFDAAGNLVDAGAPYPVTTSRTCNVNGCYRVAGDGTIEQWGTAAGCGGSSACNVAVTFPTTFTTTTNLSIQTTAQGGGFNNYHATAGSATTAGFSVQYSAHVFVGGSGSNLNGSQTAYWYAIGQ